jgi:hypothetical protein
MRIDRQLEPPRERRFAELFPWRNVRLAVLLALLIAVIVAYKGVAGRYMSQLTDWFAPPAPAKPPAAAHR